jgi:hypothetical protein
VVHIGKKFVAASSRKKPEVVERVGERGQPRFRDSGRALPLVALRADLARLGKCSASALCVRLPLSPRAFDCTEMPHHGMTEFGQGHTAAFARGFAA